MDPPVGFWQITPSDEFRSGGPLKQNLTSHVGPTTLAMFLSGHYVGDPLVPNLEAGEPWKKVFGLVCIYLNSVSYGNDPFSLWEDAKQQMVVEVQSWPYSFPASKDFPSSDQWGNVRGRLLILDRYVSDGCISANGAYVGFAPLGEIGPDRECKEYQFWSGADENGCFSIKNIPTGDYNLYAWVPGFIGDYRYDTAITITSGCEIDAGDLVYEPPRDGPTLWESASLIFPSRNSTFLILIQRILTNFLSIILTGLGSMDCGKDMQNYTLMEIWSTLLGSVTIQKIGSLLRFPDCDGVTAEGYW